MPRLGSVYSVPKDLVLGVRLNNRVPEADQKRQRDEVVEILRRLRRQPGLILADEVGMGKTYVALAVAFTVAVRSPRGPVIVMVPPNLISKWEQDLRAFCDLYLDEWHSERLGAETKAGTRDADVLRYGVARHSIELMKLLDDPPRSRCQLILLAQGAMARGQSDKWIRLALIAEAFRQPPSRARNRLKVVRRSIHRYLAQLVWALGNQNASEYGEQLWNRLLSTHPSAWKSIYNESVRNSDRRMSDDPVPKSVIRAIDNLDLRPLAAELARMPVRSVGGAERAAERVKAVREALRGVEAVLWREILTKARWRSPLLVMDEAHHLKNPRTRASRQLQSVEVTGDLKTGDGALANSFDRMLFLTATPFQLGHSELVQVLRRFSGVRWSPDELGDRAAFQQELAELDRNLDESQRAAINLQKRWKGLSAVECGEDMEEWWRDALACERESLPYRQRAVLDAFRAAKRARDGAEDSLRPWVLRHNKGQYWTGSTISRRRRFEGGSIDESTNGTGLLIPPAQLLPFFLAARSSVRASQDLLGEALSSSYEAFRETRSGKGAQRDQLDEEGQIDVVVRMTHSRWYLEQFDASLQEASGAIHPKIRATVKKAADLWEHGEKVLVFAFYRHTCKALRIHISTELERRISGTGLRRLRDAGVEMAPSELDRLVARIQNRYFDDADGPGRRAVDSALEEVLDTKSTLTTGAPLDSSEREQLLDVMRRFLRVGTTIIRCFPLAELDSLKPEEAVRQTLDTRDQSNISWREKLNGFLHFLGESCSTDERLFYVEAAMRTQTRAIRVDGDEGDAQRAGPRTALANIQVATGETERDQRARLMRAFNTPFFPDILVCSEVMGEGVDLQRFCRHVIHHDLAWNPSTIEQRTGRIDRLGCKAENRQSIHVYMPFLAGSADERQFRVMSDRERWFRVVMGEDEVGKLIAPDSEAQLPLPEALTTELSFDLGLPKRSDTP